jgi:hypothetical protein
LSDAEVFNLARGWSVSNSYLVGWWMMNNGSCTTTINAAPLKAAVQHWPGGVKERWMPATGAFYKSIIRNP